MQTLTRLLALAAVSVTAAVSSHASTFATINVNGDTSDWTGIAASYTGPSGGTFNINQVFIANDADYLYIRVQFVSAVNPNSGGGLFLSIDTDNNTSTGFDIFGLGNVGAEASWQNDFPFDQRTGWNVGGMNNGAAGISPYFTETFDQEYRISLAATFTSDNAAVFPGLGETIRIMFWSETGDSMATPGISYTFASVPEPASFASLAGLGVLGLVALRRRR